MPPLRRYLRITKYSVLECRIYLDNPADVHRWLLNPASPVLPRLINAVRPLVLPKLREENSRAKSNKGGKKKGWRDVVVEDDFEVAVFLTEVSTRHTLLRKEKTAKREKARLGTADRRLTGAGTMEVPFEVENPSAIEIRREDSQEGKSPKPSDIPTVSAGHSKDTGQTPESEQDLFVSGDSVGDDSPEMQLSQPIRRERAGAPSNPEHGVDDKKKMSVTTTYDGFAIYGRILCLVVKRKGAAKGKDPAGGSGQARMEEWIASTQLEESSLVEG